MSNKITNTRYGVMLFPEFDTAIGKCLALHGEWSQGEMDLMKLCIPKGGVCVDVGANIGCHTLFFAQAVGKKGQVFSFEPQRILFQILCANLALNDIRNCYATLTALGKNQGVAFVQQMDYDQPGNFGMCKVIEQEEKGEATRISFLDQFSLSRVDLIKIDVEGMEHEVLVGAQEMIKTHRPFIYMECQSDPSCSMCIELMHSLGYQVYEHLVPIYNKNNLKEESETLFGGYVEKNLFFKPNGKDFPIHECGMPIMNLTRILPRT